jgi:hypothetical protein
MIYLSGHLMRAFRLTVILSETSVSFVKVMSIHLYTSGLAILLPFKSSELLRFIELARLMRVPVAALVTVWIERIFDIVAVGFIILSLPLMGSEWHGDILIIIIWAIATLITLIGFFMLPPILSLSIMHLMGRYSTVWSLRAIRLLCLVKESLAHGRKMVYGPKLSLLILCTAAIWILEVLTVLTCMWGVSYSADVFFSAFNLRLGDAFGPLEAMILNSAGAESTETIIHIRSKLVIGVGLGLTGIAGFMIALIGQVRSFTTYARISFRTYS